MGERGALIARKHEVQREIQSARTRLARERAKNVSGWLARRRHGATLQRLEAKLERLMGQESRLRQAIDRSRH